MAEKSSKYEYGAVVRKFSEGNSCEVLYVKARGREDFLISVINANLLVKMPFV